MNSELAERVYAGASAREPSRRGRQSRIRSDRSRHGASRAGMVALPPVAVIPIIGARKLSQLQDNLASSDLSLSPEQVRALDEASQIDLAFPYTSMETGSPRRLCTVAWETRFWLKWILTFARLILSYDESLSTFGHAFAKARGIGPVAGCGPAPCRSAHRPVRPRKNPADHGRDVCSDRAISEVSGDPAVGAQTRNRRTHRALPSHRDRSALHTFLS
jgi:hypothetical protein